MVSTKVTLTWIKIYPRVSNIGLRTGPILNRHSAKLKLSSELVFKLSLIKSDRLYHFLREEESVSILRSLKEKDITDMAAGLKCRSQVRLQVTGQTTGQVTGQITGHTQKQ